MAWIGSASVEDFRYIHRTWSLVVLAIIIFSLLTASILLITNSIHKDLEKKIVISDKKIKELEAELERLKKK